VASIRVERTIGASPEEAWAALRDWGALHERLAPGFVVATELDGNDRLVTFFNGAVARERLVDLDDERRRLVWSIVDGPYSHHNGAAEVLDAPGGATRFIWVADLLPDEAAAPTEEMMERGIGAVKDALESRAQSRGA
jgi:polyketide cyclase/dehydrase/lipid transport protein